MEYHKKFGMIVMVISIILALFSIAISRNICFGDFSGFDYFTNCMYWSLFEDIPDNQFSALISIPTKYVLVFCGFLFGIGFLWYRGAIKVPFIKAKSE